jgi:hypothetical protein
MNRRKLVVGFDLAGLQYRYECWCGSTVAGNSVRLPEERCNSPCPESVSACGGYQAMSVYHTGFGGCTMFYYANTYVYSLLSHAANAAKRLAVYVYMPPVQRGSSKHCCNGPVSFL